MRLKEFLTATNLTYMEFDNIRFVLLSEAKCQSISNEIDKDVDGRNTFTYKIKHHNGIPNTDILKFNFINDYDVLFWDVHKKTLLITISDRKSVIDRLFDDVRTNKDNDSIVIEHYCDKQDYIWEGKAEDEYGGFRIEKDLNGFDEQCDLIHDDMKFDVGENIEYLYSYEFDDDSDKDEVCKIVTESEEIVIIKRDGKYGIYNARHIHNGETDAINTSDDLEVFKKEKELTGEIKIVKGYSV